MEQTTLSAELSADEVSAHQLQADQLSAKYGATANEETILHHNLKLFLPFKLFSLTCLRSK